MIEHIIKQFLFEQRDYKITVKAASNFSINTSKGAGGVFAFTVKFKLSGDGSNPSDKQLRKVMSRWIAENPTTGATAIGATSKFANGNYIYLVSNPLTESANRLKFTVWVIERQKLKDLAVALEDREKMSGYFYETPSNIDFESYMIGKSPIMSYNDMVNWFSVLTEAAKKQGIKLTLPNIQKINTVETEINTDEFKSKIVDITNKNWEEYPEVGSFLGKAELSFSTNGAQIITPISGRVGIIQRKNDKDGEPHSGYFKGEFKNGVPFKGTLTYYQLETDYQLEDASDIYEIWKGEFDGKAYVDKNGVRSFLLDIIPGRSKRIFKNAPALTYPYTSQEQNPPGYTDTYYLEEDSVVFVNIFAEPPAWLYVPKKELETWVDDGTVPVSFRDATPAEISSLNKNYPNVLSDAIKWKTNKQNTPVVFKVNEIQKYETTDEETWTPAGLLLGPVPADKPQYWLDASPRGYAKLIPSTKDPNLAYWVKSDQIE